MSAKRKERFRGRSFVSVLAALCFLALVVSGTVLFIKPPGRYANWTGWTLAGLSKSEWEALHISFSLLFVLTGIFHVYLNWRALLSYFRNRRLRAFAFRWDWMLALLIFAGVAYGTAAGISPFSEPFEWRTEIKHSWEETTTLLPIAHAEEMTLTEIATRSGASEDRVLESLASRGIHVETPASTLGQIAREQGMTPRELYHIAFGEEPGGRGRGQGRGAGRGAGRGRGGCEEDAGRAGAGCSQELSGAGTGAGGEEQEKIPPCEHEKPAGESMARSAGEAAPERQASQQGRRGGKGMGGMGAGRGSSGRGYGRMTLEQYCDSDGLEVESALKALRAEGLKASASMTLREVADQASMHPREVRELIDASR
jgi:hypothetical protein